MGIVYGFKELRSGTVVYVNERGRAERVTCDWLVRVPSGNPEPDSIEDTYRDVPCGAKYRRHPRFPNAPLEDALVCDNGHERISYELRATSGMEAREAWLERKADADRDAREVYLDDLASTYRGVLF